MRIEQAFNLGYAVPIVGIHFNGTELLASVVDGATGELAERVQRHIAAFKQRGPQVVENVRQVEGLLREAQIAVGPSPRVPADYYAWAEKIDRACDTVFGDDQIALSTARLVGWTLGDALLTLNVGLIAEHLLDAQPEHPTLLKQCSGLAADQRQSAERLARVASNPLVPDGARPAVAAIGAALRAAPLVGEGPRGEEPLARLQSAMRAIADQVPLVERGLMELAGGEAPIGPTKIEEENLVLWYAPSIPYLRVDLSGMVPSEKLAAKLDQPKLWELVGSTGRRAILLNFAASWKFGTSDLDYLVDGWTPQARAAGIERAALVVQKQVIDFFGNIFPPAVARAQRAGLDLRVFHEAQFTESAEAVSWL